MLLNRRRFLKTLLNAGVAATLPVNELARLSTTFYSIPKNPQLYTDGVYISYGDSNIVIKKEMTVVELYNYLKKLSHDANPLDIDAKTSKNIIKLKNNWKIGEESITKLTEGSLVQGDEVYTYFHNVGLSNLKIGFD